jgi:catechol 2,3-dioxygenase-like lactoylglutathione lyase family enzyme
MSDIVVKAAYASVVEDDEEGMLFVGFAEGEAEDEAYVLFRQPLGGGPVWFEVTDDSFGAEGALQAVQAGPKGLEITLRPEFAQRFGWATSVSVRVPSSCEARDEAFAALATMLGPVWHEA